MNISLTETEAQNVALKIDNRKNIKKLLTLKDRWLKMDCGLQLIIKICQVLVKENSKLPTNLDQKNILQEQMLEGD